MNKIRIVSFILFICFLINLIAIPVMYNVFWISTAYFSGHSQILLHVDPYGSHIPMLALKYKLACYALGAVPIIADMLICFFLMKLFWAFRNERIFALNNASLIRNVGATMLIWQVINPFYQMGFSYLLSSGLGEQVQMGFKLNTSNLVDLIMALMIFVIAWIMRRAFSLAEENAQTI